MPFKTLATSPKVGIDSPAIGESRKRKLSNPENDHPLKFSKTVTKTKENVKTDGTTTLETIDLLNDNSSDEGKKGDEKFHAVLVTPKADKKSMKSKNSEEKNEFLLRRFNGDFEESKKVLIKIPSSRKKKSTIERQGKPKAMLNFDETDNNEDDDVIPIDSGENSLLGVDDKDGSSAVDNSVVNFNIVNDKKTEDVDELEMVTEEKSKTIENKSSQAEDIQEMESSVSSENASNNSSDASGSDAIIDAEKVSDSLTQNCHDNNTSPNIASDCSDGNQVTIVAEIIPPSSGTDSEECKTPIRKAVDSSTLTPKQLQRKLESEKKVLAKQKAKEERERKFQEAKEERERKLQEAKEERERKLQEEKEQKLKERDEKERQRRKEREDKEEQRRKEREEREKKKQAEVDAKNEEKRQKEEEKRLKEEEKTAKEEAELKKKRKEAEAFTKFFAKKKNKSTEPDKMDVDETEAKLNFMPFRVKDDMRLAPIVRRKLSSSTKTNLEDLVLNSESPCSEKDLYIQRLRSSKRASAKQGKTWPTEDPSDDLMIIGTLLFTQFCLLTCSIILNCR